MPHSEQPAAFPIVNDLLAMAEGAQLASSHEMSEQLTEQVLMNFYALQALGKALELLQKRVRKLADSDTQALKDGTTALVEAALLSHDPTARITFRGMMSDINDGTRATEQTLYEVRGKKRAVAEITPSYTDIVPPSLFEEKDDETQQLNDALSMLPTSRLRPTVAEISARQAAFNAQIPSDAVGPVRAISRADLAYEGVVSQLPVESTDTVLPRPELADQTKALLFTLDTMFDEAVYLP